MTGLLVALVVLLPTATAKVVLTPQAAETDLNRRTALHLFDAVLVAIAVVAVVRWWRAGHPVRMGAVTGLGVALGGLTLISFAFHPSSHGAEVVLRVVAGLAVVLELRRLRGADRQIVLAAIFAFGVAEAMLSLAQVWNDGTLWHGPFEMSRFPLFRFRKTYAGQGSFSHPYHLVCALGVALGAGWLGLRGARPSRRSLWIAGFPVIGIALGMSYSRSVVVALGAAVAIGAVARRGAEGRPLRVVGALLVVGFLVGGYVGLDGWQYKEAVTADSTSFDSGRATLAEASRDVIDDHPFVGVGPGRYVQVAFDSGAHYRLPPHNWLLQVAAEEGIPAALVVLALSVAVGLRALRAGPEATMAFVLLAPFWLADAFPYTYPHGILLSALWLGTLHLALDEAEAHPWRPARARALVPA
jgi:hypothetical protein